MKSIYIQDIIVMRHISGEGYKLVLKVFKSRVVSKIGKLKKIWNYPDSAREVTRPK